VQQARGKNLQTLRLFPKKIRKLHTLASSQFTEEEMGVQLIAIDKSDFRKAE
jgi:hypothetical protein